MERQHGVSPSLCSHSLCHTCTALQASEAGVAASAAAVSAVLDSLLEIPRLNAKRIEEVLASRAPQQQQQQQQEAHAASNASSAAAAFSDNDDGSGGGGSAVGAPHSAPLTADIP